MGRVAFLLQPDGVRLHWVTDGDREWTGLTADNSVVEPLNRRGPRPLPLKANDWNRVTFARTGPTVTLSLNDVVIYQRPMDKSTNSQFGLSRSPTASGAQVRNVVLSGDWPESLPQEFVDNPAIVEGEPLPVAERHALNRLFQEEFLAENVFAVRRRALTLPVAERFELLSQWVLPGADHAGFRMAGDFLPTEPAPGASKRGGEIVSPVFDWLDAARELGRLAECRQQVENFQTPADEWQQRCRSALLMLLHLELDDQPAVTAEFEKLFALLKAQTPTGITDQWPETLVIDRGARKFAGNAAVADVITYVHAQRTQQWRPGGINLWHTHIAALLARQHFLKAGGSEAALAAPLALTDWIPVTAAKSATRGQGYPGPQWRRSHDSVSKLFGHDDDFLFYHLPLSGNYEVECDLMQPSHHPSQIMLAGSYVGPRWDQKHIEHGTFRGAAPHLPIEPPFTKFGPWVRYRGVVRDGTCTVFINGRLVQAESLPEPFDPWIAIRCWGKHQGVVQDMRITGRPTVLEAVPLSASPDLTGWISYHEETVGPANSRWLHV
ncbi:MAG TPA: DUF1583 domain-containing protein, partial [Planctomycetaceae bacterium]|nr:DUF1583 domain-containing protein [Planctomycetaceae bacterium]